MAKIAIGLPVRNGGRTLRHIEAVGCIGRVAMGWETDPKRLGCFPVTGVAATRLRAVLARPGDNCRTYSLFRRDALARAAARQDMVAWDWATMLAITREGELHVLDQLHIVRGTDGDSRRPRYRGVFFLWPFTKWFRREFGMATAIRCGDRLACHNLRFNAGWRMLRRIFRAASPRLVRRQ